MAALWAVVEAVVLVEEEEERLVDTREGDS